MLFVLIVLWSIGLFLFTFDGRNSATRWLAAVAFFGGCGAVAALVGDDLLPYLSDRLEPETYTLLQKTGQFFSLCQYYGLPYAYIQFAFRYNLISFLERWIKLLTYAFLLPPALTLILVRPFYPVTFPIMLIWVLPYVVVGTAIILSRREDLHSLRRNHQITSLAVVPTVVLCSIMNYVLPSMGMAEMWRYNLWFILIAAAIFLIGLFNYGILGVKLFIQNRRMDSTIRAVTSGTAILNHAIKNDVGKMRLFGEKIKRYADQTNQPELRADIEVILAASAHVQEMIHRVHDQTQDLMMQKGHHNLTDIVQSLLEQLDPESQGIEVEVTAPEEELVVYCDRAQLTEALNNVISNAIEAMPGGGALSVKLYTAKKQAVIEIADTGPGIEKHKLKQVMEPFYTSKTGSRHNFGLGLSYCYQVMKKHGGALTIRSQVGKGTTVFLTLKGVSSLGDH